MKNCVMKLGTGLRIISDQAVGMKKAPADAEA